MLPYSRGLILDNAHNYGIMKTETVFGFGTPQQTGYGNEGFNTTNAEEWMFTDGSIQKRSLQEHPTPKTINKSKPKKKSSSKERLQSKSSKKRSKKRRSKKINKCIIKFEKGQQSDAGGEEPKGKKRRRRKAGGGMYKQMHKKYMMPVILGFLAAKSILIPIALKALAFLSAKGLIMGFFSTVLASVISLKGMFNSQHESSKRNDDTKTQVEIIQVPAKSDDHVYYDDHHHDHHYKRGDFVSVYPVYPINEINDEPYDNNLLKKKMMNSLANGQAYKNYMKKMNSIAYSQRYENNQLERTPQIPVSTMPTGVK